MAETRSISFPGILPSPRNELGGTCAGHEKKIEHVGGARAAQVGMTESHDRTVRVVIPRTPVPSVVEGIGAELNHPEGNRGSRVGVPVAACANGNLHVVSEILGSSRQRR